MFMKVMLTGATGYVGRRLMDKLLNDTNVQLRVFVRNARALDDVQVKNIEVAEGDTFKPETLDNALRGINTAYYLIHSMASISKTLTGSALKISAMPASGTA
jgi:uncharacterized protein YbjT (DUF2867 family)